MGFNKLKFVNFRNLKNCEVEINSPVIFLVGKNGQGKTNFLEAIYYICFGSSFRVTQDKLAIKKKENFAYLRGQFYDVDLFQKSIDIKITESGKEIKVDSKKIKDRKVLLENIPCIIFSYDDMIFVKGSPEKKRWFFNQTLCLFDILFVDLLRNYNKILKSRNILLKNRKIDLIPVYNEELIRFGIEIQKRRKNLIQEFNNTLTPLYQKVSGMDIDLKIYYKPSWKGQEDVHEINNYLERNLSRDMALGTTTSGPHRDLFYFISGGENFDSFGSTGQVRLASLILRIAQSRFFFEKTGKKPVLLLDDVLLEIDSSKRERLMSNLPDFEQAFFTFLPNENYNNYRFENIMVYNIDNGEIK